MRERPPAVAPFEGHLRRAGAGGSEGGTGRSGASAATATRSLSADGA